MRKSKVLIISAVTGLAVIGTTAGVAYSSSNQSSIVAEAATNQEETTKDTTTTSLEDVSAKDILNKVTDSNLINTDAAQKEETVYVIADATGTTQKVIVSEWLKNPDNAAELTDQSNITDIKNVKGDETFTQGENGQITWQANGNDIYYQGTSTEELPLTMNIVYTLDGTEVKPEELVGKSGKVTMTFNFDSANKVPFLTVSGMLLDNSVFSNVEVSNGKVINDGSKIVVIGAALPGVQDSFDVASDDLSIPAKIEVSADVVNYSPVTSMTFVTNDIFNHIELGDLSDMDSLKDAMNELSSSVAKLVDGSNTLYEGLSTLSEKSSQLSTAIGTLSTGAVTLNTGIKSLVDGAKKINDGAVQIKNGLGALNSKNDTLNGAAAQVFTSLLSNAQTQLTAAGLQLPDLTIENYEKTLNGVIAQLSKGKDEQSQYAVKAVQGVLTSLQSYQQFYDGLGEYTGAVSQLNAGSQTLAAATEQLNQGIAKLASGSEALVGGLGQLGDAGVALIDGVNQLKDGSKALADGLSLFNESGIDKLVNMFDGDITNLISQVSDMIEASEDYQSFGGIEEGMTGSVKFIIKAE